MVRFLSVSSNSPDILSCMLHSTNILNRVGYRRHPFLKPASTDNHEFFVDIYATFDVSIQIFDNVNDLSTDTYVSKHFPQCFLPQLIKRSFKVNKIKVNSSIMFFLPFLKSV